MMLLSIHGVRNEEPSHAACARSCRKFVPSGVAACTLLLAVFATTYQGSSQTPSTAHTPDYNKPVPLPDANRAPDQNAQMVMRDQVKTVNYETANAERKRQIADDSARLLKLANDLKVEVDKTSKDTLSLGVIRKAEEIEKLAHSVKEKMKLTMGGN